jgi:glutamate dehydrogenase/leucine dehydrogenase
LIKKLKESFDFWFWKRGLGVALKVNDLGGKVVTISGPDGYIYDEEGILAIK